MAVPEAGPERVPARGSLAKRLLRSKFAGCLNVPAGRRQAMIRSLLSGNAVRCNCRGLNRGQAQRERPV
jgi:hypothetical protein